MKCINFTKYKTKDKSFHLINKKLIQMSKGRFSQSQAQIYANALPMHSAKNRSAHCYCYEVYK